MERDQKETVFSLSKQFVKDNYIILFRLFLLSIAGVLVMEFLSRLNFREYFAFLAGKPPAVIYNILIVYFTLCLSLLFRKRLFWLCLIGGIWMGICVANTIMLRYRSMPLTAPDIFLMSSVRDIFAIYLSPMGLIGLMILISTLVALILYIWLCVKKDVWIPLFAVVHCGLLLISLFLIDVPFVERGYVDARDDFQNISQAYEDNGFAYCLSASFITGGVKEPEEYSATEVREIIDSTENQLPGSSTDSPNIIFVQLESFFDPYYMKDISYPYDPIPNFRHLKENYSHGFLSVPCIGAGTANTEFEVLTGMNLSHFGVGEYPYMTIVDSGKTTSIASELWNLGYDTHAIHNNNATFYNRHIVYDNLGFRTFTSVEYMTDVTYNALGWAKDSCLTDEIMKCLADGEDKKLIYTVSVEPHGRYPKEPLENVPIIPIQGMEEEGRKNGFEYYLYALSQSDLFVGELIDTLSEVEEDTMVVFFGDHLPSFNIQDEELSSGTNQTTEYVIWTNYPMKQKVQDLQTYQLSAYIMELVGIYEGPVFRHHQNSGYASIESDDYQEALRTLEFDIIYGEEYALEYEITPNKPGIQLGVTEILIRDILAAEGQEGFTVTGNNFTPFSVVYVNETPCTTTYLSSEELRVEEPIPTIGDRVLVAQVSAVDPLTVLSESIPLVISSDYS